MKMRQLVILGVSRVNIVTLQSIPMLNSSSPGLLGVLLDMEGSSMRQAADVCIGYH